MYRFEKDLRERRILDRSFGAVHVVAENLSQNLSGYVFYNNAVGSQGMTASEPWPGSSPREAIAACWTWVHEFQHTFEKIVSEYAPQQTRPMHGHFLENFPLPAGERFDAGGAYDGQRELFRRFNGYDALLAPHFHCLEALDEDRDGMPDDDPRLPADERRFESKALHPDSDEDGLNDLDEFCAGLYAGSHPGNKDTDTDGDLDGEDPYPLSSFTGRIPFGTPRRGEVPKGLLSQVAYFTQIKEASDIRVHASWDHDYLYLQFETKPALSITLAIDGSGHLGRFESDRAVDSGKEGMEVQRFGSDVYAGEHALHVSFGSPHMLCGKEKVQGAKVLSAERDGKRVIWLAIPARLGPGSPQCFIRENANSSSGLTLEPGRILGFSFTAFPHTAVENPRRSKWCSLYEPHRFYDAVLLPEN